MAASSEILPGCLQDAGFQVINNTIFGREYQYRNSHLRNSNFNEVEVEEKKKSVDKVKKKIHGMEDLSP
jgi:hypothetical protein